MKEDEFTQVIRQILSEQFAKAHEDILHLSPILQYLNHKMISASRGVKGTGVIWQSLFGVCSSWRLRQS